jgi:hypothetical protein
MDIEQSSKATAKETATVKKTSSKKRVISDSSDNDDEVDVRKTAVSSKASSPEAALTAKKKLKQSPAKPKEPPKEVDPMAFFGGSKGKVKQTPKFQVMQVFLDLIAIKLFDARFSEYLSV